MDEHTRDFCEDIAARIRGTHLLKPREVAVVRDVLWGMFGQHRATVVFGESPAVADVLKFPSKEDA